MSGRNPLQTNDFYEFEDFRLDLREKELLKCGDNISLAPKVFDTLSVLVANAGHLLEKEDLINLIWTDGFVEESNLTYNIKMLRRALGVPTNVVTKLSPSMPGGVRVKSCGIEVLHPCFRFVLSTVFKAGF